MFYNHSLHFQAIQNAHKQESNINLNIELKYGLEYYRNQSIMPKNGRPTAI